MTEGWADDRKYKRRLTRKGKKLLFRNHKKEKEKSKAINSLKM